MSDYFDRELADTIEARTIQRRQCADPGCQVRGVTVRQLDEWFCSVHAKQRRLTHNRIVLRILSIPARD